MTPALSDQLTLPTARDEAWRWADLSALPALAGAPHGDAAIDPGACWLECGGPRLLFVDGVYDPARSDPGAISIGPVAGGSAHPLGRLAIGDGWTLTVAEGQSVPAPIEIVHIATGGANHVPARIALGRDAQAVVVETFVGDGWANRLTAIALAPGARLMRSVRLVQEGGFVSLRDEATVADAASLTTIVLGAGRAGSRIDASVTLDGAGAFAEVGGALLARDTQKHDAAIVIRHAAPDGASRQTWRAVADDRAIASMAARVEVARDAQRTDGVQSLKGLLLARTAAVNLKPELEIFADDVKCAHGATVGELDRQALFYCASRGIPPVAATALLTRAFVGDALARIGDERVRDAFAADADAWLEKA